jgi:hypothetical protein
MQQLLILEVPDLPRSMISSAQEVILYKRYRVIEKDLDAGDL